MRQGCGRCEAGCRVQAGSDLTLDWEHVCLAKYSANVHVVGAFVSMLIVCKVNEKTMRIAESVKHFAYLPVSSNDKICHSFPRNTGHISNLRCALTIKFRLSFSL